MAERQELTTRHGHPLDEARSALHKMLRRGQEADALYWAAQLNADFPAYLWRTLFIVASEDVGLAEANLPANLYALHQAWLAPKQERHRDIFAVHAVLLIARARKSRITDHALQRVWETDERRPVPDVAVDQFTKRGRRMGRGHQHFVDEGSLLADPATGELSREGSIPDRYLERPVDPSEYRIEQI
jgi:replication-associated recombination protein RarA